MDLTLLLIVIVLAFAFDFINGFHDSANSIAVVVSTKVLTPFQAVVWAAAFNFLAYAVFELNIADTIAKIVDTNGITLQVILAGVIAAIIWNLVTWRLGIPSSSSHTLVGGFAGAAVAYAGWGVVHSAIIIKIAAFIFLAPILGMIIAYIITVIMMYLFRNINPAKTDHFFKPVMLLASALFSLGHGGNDAQKVMGIIAAALIVYFKGVDPALIPEWAQITYTAKGTMHTIPHWIVLGCYTAISAGTLVGGYRIIKTMGSKITKLSIFEGVAANISGAILLFGTESFGIPVSTTHTITGSIIGVGMTKRLTAVRWGVTVSLLWAWILTIPVSALIAMLIYWFMLLF